MENTPRPDGRTRLKRRIAVASVVIGFACLAAMAIEPHPPWYAAIAPFLAVACGLEYLRSTGPRR